MLLKCYYHLHPLVEFERGVVDQKVEEDMSLDIFEMTTNTNEPSTKLINRELLMLVAPFHQRKFYFGVYCI
jgi:hypothetical protein